MIPDFLSQGEICSVRAEEKTGGSWHMLQMAYAWSAGESFIDVLRPPKPLKILFIDPEGLEEQQQYRLKHIRRFLGYDPGQLFYHNLRKKPKTLETLRICLLFDCDIVFIDSPHWFGKPLEVYDFLFQCDKTCVLTESFRFVSSDYRPHFGYSPADTILSFLPSMSLDYKVVDFFHRNHPPRKRLTAKIINHVLQADGSDVHVYPKFKRQKNLIEYALQQLQTCTEPCGKHWKDKLITSLKPDFTSIVEYCLREELVMRVGKRYFITKQGAYLLSFPVEDPTLRTICDFAVDQEKIPTKLKEDKELFGPIEDCWPMPIKL